MREFKETHKIEVSPYSKYYAIEAIEEDCEKNAPLMIIVDPSRNPEKVLAKSITARQKISAIIVPELAMIDREFCYQMLDSVGDLRVALYEVPLIAEHRGSVRSNSEIMKIFSN